MGLHEPNIQFCGSLNFLAEKSRDGKAWWKMTTGFFPLKKLMFLQNTYLLQHSILSKHFYLSSNTRCWNNTHKIQRTPPRLEKIWSQAIRFLASCTNRIGLFFVAKLFKPIGIFFFCEWFNSSINVKFTSSKRLYVHHQSCLWVSVLVHIFLALQAWIVLFTSWSCWKSVCCSILVLVFQRSLPTFAILLWPLALYIFLDLSVGCNDIALEI